MRPASVTRLHVTTGRLSTAATALALLTVLPLLLSSFPGRAMAQAPVPCYARIPPGQSLRAAIGSAAAGGVICPAAGAYAETPVFDHTTPPGVTLRGAGPEATVLDGLGLRNGMSLLDNGGIGVSFVNGVEVEIAANHIMWNLGSAVCLHHTGSVNVGRNTIGGNLANKVGVCAEQRH